MSGPSTRPKVRPTDRISLKFPIEDENLYKGRIIFKAYKEDYKTLVKTGFDLVDGSSIADPNRIPETNRVISAPAAEANKKRIDELYRSSADNDTRKALPREIGNNSTCTLFLPGALQFQDRIEYTNVDLNIIGAAAARAITAGGSGKEILKNSLREALPNFESLQSAFRTGLKSEAAQVAALRVSNKLSPELTGALETSTGITLNPNRRQTLKGVGIRQFVFTFKLIPTTQLEANEITRIIKFFRSEMYPDTSAEGLEAALKFPSKFKIRMMYGKKQVTTGILPCFLENVNVVYNPTNTGFHSDGAGGADFQETDISLSFIEERALTKRDIVFEEY
tara:strand:+ start:7896 stop:8906 length:1011 start_codon:yes stop_codon:yes gene_type:complete